MKAYEIRGPKGVDSLNSVDRPNPRPGYGEVLICVCATSVGKVCIAI
jgi:NADPH:quinone reductase-like Zn-dependent oxidoreductase